MYMDVKLLCVSIYMRLPFFVHGCFCCRHFLQPLQWRQDGWRYKLTQMVHEVKAKDVEMFMCIFANVYS